MDFFTSSSTASSLVANVGGAAQTSIASLGPVIEVVAGIILAFIVVRYSIGLFKHVGKR